MKQERTSEWVLVVALMLWANTAFGAPVEVVGEMQTVDGPGGAQGAVVFRDGTKQMTAVSVTGSGTAPAAARSDHDHSSQYVSLTADQTIGGAKTFSGQVLSTVATGTAPFAVTSQTGVTNLNADMLDGQHSTAFAPSTHSHDAVYQKKYGKVAVVAKSEGDYGSPVDAMNALATWCRPADDTTTPCLVKIMPGVYDIGTGTVRMQTNVDVEGSGENTTVIKGSIGEPDSGVVRGADFAEIRFLAVQHVGGGSISRAVYNGTASPGITNVTAAAWGGTEENHGVYNHASSPVMTNVTATGQGGAVACGVYNDSSSPVMVNVTAKGLRGSVFSHGVANYSSSKPVMTNVSALASGGIWGHGVYSESSAPVMTNVTASATRGKHNHGLRNTSSNPTMTNVSGSGDSGDYSYGVFNSNSSPVMRDVTISAENASEMNVAMRNDDNSAPLLSNVTASASGGGLAYGVYSLSTAASAEINRSTLSASGGTYESRAIRNDSAHAIKVGSSMLAGGAAGSAFLCAYCYDNNYRSLSTVCQ